MPGKTHGAFKVGERNPGIKVDLRGSAIRLRWRGIDVMTRVWSPRVAELAADAGQGAARYVEAPALPDAGRLSPPSRWKATVVEAGQTLAIVEAMKMENVLKAERAGVVKTRRSAAGDELAVDEVILEFEAVWRARNH